MATNEFLPFATGPAPNIISQAAFATSGAVVTGFESGVADSATANKLFRQAQWMAYVVAQWIVNESGQNMLDDANFTNAQTALIAAINKMISDFVTAGGYATATSVANEAATRLTNDNTEQAARIKGDSDQQIAWQAGDQGIWNYLGPNNTNLLTIAAAAAAAASVPRYATTGGTARQNWIPTNNSNVSCILNYPSSNAVAVNQSGGTIFAVASANVSNTEPSAASLIMYFNGVQMFGEYTNGSMTGMFVWGVAPNSRNVIEAHYTVTGATQAFGYVGLNLSYIFVNG